MMSGIIKRFTVNYSLTMLYRKNYIRGECVRHLSLTNFKRMTVARITQKENVLLALVVLVGVSFCICAYLIST